MKNHVLSRLTVTTVFAATIIVASANSRAARGGAPQAANPSAQKLLTIADVEAVTGVKGVKLVPKDPKKGAGGDVNFAKPDGSLLVMLIAAPGTMYDAWKSQSGAFNASVSGVGDEAFIGPANVTPYVLFFRKGKNSASISSFLNSDMKPLLTQDQIKALAKLVASRL